MDLSGRFRRFWAWLDLDARDIQYYGGWALLVVGFWWMYAPVALVVGGVLLIYPAMRTPPEIKAEIEKYRAMQR